MRTVKAERESPFCRNRAGYRGGAAGGGVVASVALRILVAAAIWLAGAGQTGREILPPPRPIPMPPIMPVISGFKPVSMEIDADVEGVRLSATYRVRFKNTGSIPLEGTVLVPVPPGVSIERFAMRIGEEVVGGELLTADEARRIYEEIVRRRRDPAILSLVGDSALSIRVFPVPPGEERSLEVRWTGLLSREGGEYRFRLPMQTSLEAAPERLSVRIHVQTTEPIATLYSPVDGVRISRDTPRSANLRYESGGERIPFEFSVFFSTTDEPAGITVIPYREAGEDGYALILVSPGVPEEGLRSAKHFILVMDTSGSMAGEKIRNLKDGARYILNQLRAGDRFNLIAFEGQVRLFEPSSVEVSEESIERALKFVEGLEAVGGTNIDEALLRALRLARPASLPTYIVFITDGLPTVGVQNPEEILKDVAAQQLVGRRARLFVLGVGLDVNVAFLDRLAHENGGTSEYVRTGAELEQKMSDLYRRLQAPVITEARLTLSGVRAYEVFPSESFDLFAGFQTVLALRYSGEGRANVSLTGTYRGRPIRLEKTAIFPGRAAENPYVARIWATRKIAALLDEIRLKGGSQELVDSIIFLSRKYGIVTPYTDFLILEPGMRAEEARDRLLGGGGFGGGFGGGPAPLAPPPSPEAAEAAQAASRNIAGLSRAETAGSAGDRNLRVCGARSFIYRNDRWEEIAFAEALKKDPRLKPRPIAFLGEDYFRLLQANPDLRECFASAIRIVLKISDTWYEVVDEPKAK
jgi:Ca-activated chloride channel family protein